MHLSRSWSVHLLGVVNGGRQILSLFIILSWRVIRIVGVRGQRCAVGAGRSVGWRGSAARHGHQLGWAAEQIVVGAGRRGDATSSGAGSSSIRWASAGGAGNGCEGRNEKCDEKLHGTALSSFPFPFLSLAVSRALTTCTNCASLFISLKKERIAITHFSPWALAEAAEITLYNNKIIK